MCIGCADIDPTTHKILVEIIERREKGVAKYGQDAHSNPLSYKEWLQHLKEELMDGIVYIQRAIDEAP